MKQKTDIELVQAIQSGNILAFEELVSRYQRGLLSFSNRVVRDEKTAEEVVQDAFFRVYTSIHSIDTSKKFSTYLFQIAKNTAISTLRKHRPQSPLTEMLASDDDINLYEVLAQKDEAQRVRAAVLRLPAAYRNVVDLYYFHDLSYEEVGNRLKLPLNTVRTHLKRAKTALKELLYEKIS